MTVTNYKFSIIGIGLILLGGCSFNDELQVADQTDNPTVDAQTVQKIPSALDVCKAEPGSPYYYRKVVLVAGTTAVHDVARDLPGLANLTSRRLHLHLEALERFKVLVAHHASFESRVLNTATQASQLGRQHASQFVVKLELQDLTVNPAEGFFSGLLGDGDKRNVLISLSIYDTTHGALFHSQRYQATVSGDVIGYPGNATTVTDAWFSTNLGAKIDGMLKDMSQQINEKLACVPFTTRVTAVKGDSIYIDAGYLQGIRPGEAFRVYRSSKILALDGTRRLEKKSGWIRVTTVFPDYSIAASTEDDAGSVSLDVNDVVRAW